jgi:hypothetical protein
MFRKLYLERRMKNANREQKASLAMMSEFNSVDSKEFSSDLILPALDVSSENNKTPAPRPGMTRRSSSLRLLKKPSCRQIDNVESFRTFMPRRRSSVRIAKHIGSSRKLLCRMTSQDQLIVNPHQAEGAEDVSYYQLEIVPTEAPPKALLGTNDPDDDAKDGSGDEEEGSLADEEEGDSDDLSTASDPMCYNPVRTQQRKAKTPQEDEFEKNHKSLSAFSMLALFLSNNQSESSRRSRHHDAQTHC